MFIYVGQTQEFREKNKNVRFKSFLGVLVYLGTISRFKIVNMNKRVQVPVENHKKYGLPVNGCFFFTQASMFTAAEDCLQVFMIAFDKKIISRPPGHPETTHKQKNGVKIMGFFRNEEEYHQSILSLPITDRCFYQLIYNSAKYLFALYLDIEWNGTIDNEHLYISKIITKIQALYNAIQGNTLKLTMNVSCSSREGKNSYHLICPMMLFTSNCDGNMKSFANLLMKKNETELDEEINMKIDTAVYTKNRYFRSVGCTKRGGSHILKRINSDDNDLLNNTYEEKNVLQWQHSNILQPKNAGEIFKYIPKDITKLEKRKTSNTQDKTSKKAKITQNTDTNTILPLFFTKLFIGERGILKRIPAPNCIPKTLENEINIGNTSYDKISFFYLQHAEICAKRYLCGTKHKHSSNNAWVVHYKDISDVDHIFVKCLCSYDAFKIRTDHLGIFCTVWPLLKNVLLEPFGFKNAPDIKERTDKYTRYQADVSNFSRVMQMDPLFRFKWSSYIPERGWVLVPGWLASIEQQK